MFSWGKKKDNKSSTNKKPNPTGNNQFKVIYDPGEAYVNSLRGVDPNKPKLGRALVHQKSSLPYKQRTVDEVFLKTSVQNSLKRHQDENDLKLAEYAANLEHAGHKKDLEESNDKEQMFLKETREKRNIALKEAQTEMKNSYIKYSTSIEIISRALPDLTSEWLKKPNNFIMLVGNAGRISVQIIQDPGDNYYKFNMIINDERSFIIAAEPALSGNDKYGIKTSIKPLKKNGHDNTHFWPIKISKPLRALEIFDMQYTIDRIEKVYPTTPPLPNNYHMFMIHCESGFGFESNPIVFPIIIINDYAEIDDTIQGFTKINLEPPIKEEPLKDKIGEFQSPSEKKNEQPGIFSRLFSLFSFKRNTTQPQPSQIQQSIQETPPPQLTQSTQNQSIQLVGQGGTDMNINNNQMEEDDNNDNNDDLIDVEKEAKELEDKEETKQIRRTAAVQNEQKEEKRSEKKESKTDSFTLDELMELDEEMFQKIKQMRERKRKQQHEQTPMEEENFNIMKQTNSDFLELLTQMNFKTTNQKIDYIINEIKGNHEQNVKNGNARLFDWETDIKPKVRDIMELYYMYQNQGKYSLNYLDTIDRFLNGEETVNYFTVGNFINWYIDEKIGKRNDIPRLRETRARALQAK